MDLQFNSRNGGSSPVLFEKPEEEKDYKYFSAGCSMDGSPNESVILTVWCISELIWVDLTDFLVFQGVTIKQVGLLP